MAAHLVAMISLAELGSTVVVVITGVCIDDTTRVRSGGSIYDSDCDYA